MSGQAAGFGGRREQAGEGSQVRSVVASKARRALSWWVRSVATLGPTGSWK